MANASYPPAITDAEAADLVTAIKDWTAGNGLVIRPPPAVIAAEADPKGITAVSAPVTLFPSPFPKECFAQARSVQESYNALYASVARDEALLEHAVKAVADGDEFTRNLWAIHTKVKAEGYTQDLSLGLFRSDYMVHQDTTTSPPTSQVKQVEFNTIASSFGGLSYNTSNLHKFLSATEYPLLDHAIPAGSLDLPDNQSTVILAKGIEAAYHAYPESELGHQKCIIFLTQSGERNVFDQRHLEYQITKSSPGAPVFRLAFSDFQEHTSLADTSKRQLLYHMPRNPSKTFEAAVVYLRAGYGPDDYPDQKAWDTRLQLERSAAIKCPTVLSQVSGTKKVQQILATPTPESEPSALNAYLADGTPEANALRKTFTNIYPMDTSEAGQHARKLALDPATAEAYVLKPQREGGGNNIYRGDIPKFLASTPEEHWGSYILMELITPPPVSNVILRNGNLERGGVICELGIYGTCVWSHTTGKVLHNEAGGYLLRTKGDKSNEGGVAAGYGCMDSVCLV